jgi:hypothetical protein
VLLVQRALASTSLYNALMMLQPLSLVANAQPVVLLQA